MYFEDETDDETNISDNSDINNIYYEPEEPSLKKYNIILCELYNRKIHGVSYNKIVKYNYLVISRYKTLNNTIKSDAYYYNNKYSRCNKSHDIFKNYGNIISNPNYIKPEIAECIYLSSGECIAILKTIWIRIIQKKWKKIYRERQVIINQKTKLNELKFREIYGRWNTTYLYYPSLQGMLSSLSRRTSSSHSF